jgi:hypothetical protein
LFSIRHSIQFLASGDLAGLQKGFDEFTFAANGHARKFLEPFFFRHFGLGIEPFGKQAKLVGGNISAADPVKQMGQKLRWKIVTADARHGYSP